MASFITRSRAKLATGTVKRRPMTTKSIWSSRNWRNNFAQTSLAPFSAMAQPPPDLCPFRRQGVTHFLTAAQRPVQPFCRWQGQKAADVLTPQLVKCLFAHRIKSNLRGRQPEPPSSTGGGGKKSGCSWCVFFLEEVHVNPSFAILSLRFFVLHGE